jgi:type 1 glutamine amidotransferase
VDELPLLKRRLLAINGGTRAAAVSDLLLQAFRLDLKPLFISVDPTGVDALEKALQPAMAARVRQVIDSPHGGIRGPEKLPAEMRQQIEAALPAQAPAKPKKPRKMLVLDLNMWSGHGTIPHGNYLLDLFGKKLGLYETLFSNDLNNLKYPKVKEFDAVFLNNVVGMVFPDPEVRDGLIRYVREGGGLGGIHGTTYAALDSPEFTDMLGGFAGEHHVEKQVLKIDDPNSPLTRAFGGKPFEHTDEFYHFPANSPFSREKSHVLLSIDVERSDMATNGRLCAKCTRPDHDYAMSWIKSYGKGRVFCTPLGHTPILFTDRRWAEHLLAGVQFILGDLEADTTPSAKLTGRKK